MVQLGCSLGCCIIPEELKRQSLSRLNRTADAAARQLNAQNVSNSPSGLEVSLILRPTSPTSRRRKESLVEVEGRDEGKGTDEDEERGGEEEEEEELSR